MEIAIKTICCIGAGYVGGPTMAIISDMMEQGEKEPIFSLKVKKIKV